MGGISTAESGPRPVIDAQINPALQMEAERGLGSKLALAALAVGTLAMGAVGSANAATYSPEVKKYSSGDVEYTQTDSTTVLIGSTKKTEEAFAKLRIIGNHATVSKAKIKNAKRNDQCITVSGKKAIEMGVFTQGKDGSGVEYAPENRKSTLCDTDGDGRYDVRANCRNRIKIRKPNPEKAKQTLWVGNFNKANIRIRSKVAVEAYSGCYLSVPGGYVNTGAKGKAESSTDVRIKLRTAVKAGGKKVKEISTTNSNQLGVELANKASTEVTSTCVSSGGTTSVEQCPPGATGIPPNCYPIVKPINRPPNGRMNPPDHLYSTVGTRDICITDISDPDGDRVNAHSFNFRNTYTNQPIGTWEPNAVFTLPNGDQCTKYTVNSSYMGSVTVSAVLSDGRGGNTTVQDNFPVLDGNDYGGN